MKFNKNGKAIKNSDSSCQSKGDTAEALKEMFCEANLAGEPLGSIFSLAVEKKSELS